MLSFFSKKKETPPEEVIQGPAAASNSNGDDFIFVDRKTDDQPETNSSLYPSMPGMIYPPALPHASGGAGTARGNVQQQAQISYVEGVPFSLAPELSTKGNDVTQTKVDGILALLTRQMSMEEAEEYSFQLERSVCDECY